MSNLFVLGMHRSGTSALAGALAACGFYLGRELLPPDPGFNDKGFFESEAVVAIHDEFFAAFGVDWRYCYRLPADCFKSKAADIAVAQIRFVLETDYQTNQPWCIKDPRASVLFPLWRKVLDEEGTDYRVLITQRGPDAIAASLSRRNALSANHSHLMWLYYSLSAEYHTRSSHRAFIDYDELLLNPNQQLSNAFIEIGLKGIDVVEDLGIEKALKHEINESVQSPALVTEVYGLLSSRPPSPVALDPIRLGIGQLLPLLPDTLALERVASRRLSDLELAGLHIENIERSLLRANDHSKNQQQIADDLRTDWSLVVAEVERLKVRLEQAENPNTVETVQPDEKAALLESKLIKANVAFESIRSSLFWRLTRPARYCVEQLRRLKSIRTKRSLHRIALKPDQQIQLSEGWYISTGDSPQMLLVTDQNRLPAGNVELAFEVVDGSCELNSKLIVNHGFEEHHLEIELPAASVGVNSVKISLPTHTNCLRFDPLNGEGRFDICNFTVKELF